MIPKWSQEAFPVCRVSYYIPPNYPPKKNTKLNQHLYRIVWLGAFCHPTLTLRRSLFGKGQLICSDTFRVSCINTPLMTPMQANPMMTSKIGDASMGSGTYNSWLLIMYQYGSIEIEQIPYLIIITMFFEPFWKLSGWSWLFLTKEINFERLQTISPSLCRACLLVLYINQRRTNSVLTFSEINVSKDPCINRQDVT